QPARQAVQDGKPAWERGFARRPAAWPRHCPTRAARPLQTAWSGTRTRTPAFSYELKFPSRARLEAHQSVRTKRGITALRRRSTHLAVLDQRPDPRRRERKLTR